MKPLFIISCPIDTYSGYGARSRDLVKAIIELDKYDVKILPQRWGNTPWNFIEDHQEEWGFLQPHLLPFGNQLPAKPKIWAQVTVPNEFQPVGDYNIGFTAGIETTVCDPSWIEGLNRMDLNIVSSKHAKEVFENSKFSKQDNQGNVLEEVFLKKPIEVLLEGANLTKYFPTKETNSIDLSYVKENFAFLAAGHWMSGDLGEDRKNIGLLVKLFYETFKNQKKTPALILKTSGAGASYMDRDYILSRIYSIKETIEADTLPNIYLLHGEFTDQEINELYNHKKVKAMVSLTKGEGFGRPLLEFSLTKKPIITTNWSGHIDFLNEEFTALLPGELHQLDDSSLVKDVLMKEFQWFGVNHTAAVVAMKDMFTNYKNYKEKAIRQAYKSRTEFSFEQMVNQLKEYLDQYVPEFPKEVKLELPKLQLPKLKKVEDAKR